MHGGCSSIDVVFISPVIYWGIMSPGDLSLEPVAPIRSWGKVLEASSQLEAFCSHYLPIIINCGISENYCEKQEQQFWSQIGPSGESF